VILGLLLLGLRLKQGLSLYIKNSVNYIFITINYWKSNNLMQLSCPNMGCDVLGCGDIGYLKVIEKGKEKKKK
jgi:hypothetical protein